MTYDLMRDMEKTRQDSVLANLEQGNGYPTSINAMCAALLWLAENVTQEMLDAADYELCSGDSFVTKEVIAAALRKAAGK